MNQIINIYEYIPEFIKGWQDQGYIIGEDPEIIAGLLKLIFTIGFDEETIAYIGKEKFQAIFNKLIKIIIDYFIIQ
ncbi:MAG: hypothetical protein ACFFBP_05265 [Promethearchaeota archaeon]